MQSFPFLFSTAILCLSLSSCCTKKYCDDQPTIGSINFYGFASQDELDSIIIYKYHQNSGFTFAFDSVEVETSPSTTTKEYFTFWLKDRLPLDFDYKIKINGHLKEYLLHSFKKEKRLCNGCFLGNDFYDELTSYKVNNELRNTSLIQIGK